MIKEGVKTTIKGKDYEKRDIFENGTWKIESLEWKIELVD